MRDSGSVPRPGPVLANPASRHSFTDLGAALASVTAARRWFFNGAIEGAPLVVLCGPEKSAKSWALLDGAVTAIAGGRWIGAFECDRPGGDVIYLDGENGDYEFVRRVARVCRGRGIAPASVLPKIHHLYGQGFALTRDNGVALWLHGEVRRIRPTMIVIDPLRNHLAGDENAAKDVVEAMDVAASLRDASSAPLFLLHHLNRSGTVSGSRALGARADLILEGSDGVTPWYTARGRTLRHADAVTRPFTLSVSHDHDEDDTIASTRVCLRFRGEDAPQAELGAPEKRILHALRTNGGAMGANELKRAGDVASGSVLRSKLDRLRELRLVRQQPDGRWVSVGGL